jgi:hypothetical protein
MLSFRFFTSLKRLLLVSIPGLTFGISAMCLGQGMTGPLAEVLLVSGFLSACLSYVVLALQSEDISIAIRKLAFEFRLMCALAFLAFGLLSLCLVLYVLVESSQDPGRIIHQFEGFVWVALLGILPSLHAINALFDKDVF